MVGKIAAWIRRKLGWRYVSQPPALRQYLYIVAPHTSNWDFMLGLMAKFELGMKVNFVAKHQLFWPPLGWLLKALGGFPVNRSRSNNFVQATVEVFQAEPDFILAVTPEGTRGPVKRWKTGFYHMAKGAGIPIVPVAFDFRHRQIVFGDPLWPGDCKAADMAQLLAFFRPHRGRFVQPIPHYKPGKS